MGIFDFFRRKKVDNTAVGSETAHNAVAFPSEIKNQLMARPTDGFALTAQKIPAHRQNLLYFSNEEVHGHGFGLNVRFNINSVDRTSNVTIAEADDPSTIYRHLPVKKPDRIDAVPKLSYFPNYSGMNPEQRWIYGQWLCDIEQPVEIGYVFVYFYGLERQLVTGNFDGAADEILLLRRFHLHPSFLSYSGSSLVHACLLRKRLDRLHHLYTLDNFEHFSNSNLLALHHSGLDMTPEFLEEVANTMPGINRRRLRESPELYREALVEVLQRKFGNATYPFASRFPLENITSVGRVLFANISLPPEVRSPDLPNFYQHAPFHDELSAFFKEVNRAAGKKIKTEKQKIENSSNESCITAASSNSSPAQRTTSPDVVP